jgi:hypothetical protein
MFTQRLKSLVNSLLRTNEIEQFLRALKKFYANSSTKFYSLLQDSLVALYNSLSSLSANQGDYPQPVKKDIFSYLQPGSFPSSPASDISKTIQFNAFL